MQAMPDRWRDMPRVSLGDQPEGSTVWNMFFYEYMNMFILGMKKQRPREGNDVPNVIAISAKTWWPADWPRVGGEISLRLSPGPCMTKTSSSISLHLTLHLQNVLYSTAMKIK